MIPGLRDELTILGAGEKAVKSLMRMGCAVAMRAYARAGAAARELHNAKRKEW